MHANPIVDWKNQLLTRAAGVFGADTAAVPAVDLKELHAKIARLALENDFLAGALDKVGLVESKAMIDRSPALPINRQAERVGISRANVYYLPSAVSEAEQRLMRRIDALNLAYQHRCFGQRRELAQVRQFDRNPFALDTENGGRPGQRCGPRRVIARFSGACLASRWADDRRTQRAPFTRGFHAVGSNDVRRRGVRRSAQ